jgi:acyl dehydratase
MIWFEDVEIGRTAEIGSYLFTADEIIAFARDYDPQPFHLSEEAGRASLFGGLAASGWHTAAVWMKLYIAWLEREAAAAIARGEPVAAAGPSPGFENLRWLKPVMAGDTLTYRCTPTDKRRSGSRPGWSLVYALNEAHNQTGERVFHFTSCVFMPVRDRAG